MEKQDLKIMIVTEDHTLVEQFRYLFTDTDLDVDIAEGNDYQDVISEMAHNSYDIFMVDGKVFTDNGTLLIKRAREQGCDSALVLICDSEKECDRIKILRDGGTTYLCRDTVSAELLSYLVQFTMDLNSYNLESNIANRNMRVLAQSQQVGMMLVDEELKVKLANNFAVHMSGSISKFKPGNKVGEIIHCYQNVKCEGSCGDERHRSFCPLIKCIDEAFANGKGVIQREMELAFSNEKYDTKMWARVSVKPVTLSGEKHVVITIDDLTERHEMEKMLKNAQEKSKADQKHLVELNKHFEEIVSHTNQMAQEAFEANKAKSDFLANVSHELRTPLNGILGFSQLLMDESLTMDQKEHVDTIYGCAKDLIKVLNNILEFSRLEKNIITISKCWFTIDDIIDYVIVLYKDAAEKKGLGFHITRSTDCPHEVRSDLPKLKQAIFNIVENAIKYTDSGYVELTISGKKINDTAYVSFDVSDTGIGISESQQHNIFDSFSQADMSRTREYDGLGLGLTVAKKYVDLLGGVIEFKSKETVGSSFTVSIPVDKKLGHNRDVKDNSGLESKGILVAESESHQLNIIKGYLDQMKVDCELTSSGSEAIDKILNNKYDFILLDITLPELHDECVLELVRQRSEDTPIIGVCPSKDETTEELCAMIGCKEKIFKPVLKSKLDTITFEYSSVSQDKIEEALDSDAESFFSEVPPVSHNQDSVEAEVSSLASDPDMSEIVDCFIEMIPEYVHNIKDAVKIGSMADVARIAFDFRDSAGAAGFTQLRKLVLDLEKSAIVKDIEKVNLILPELIDSAARIKKVKQLQ